MKIRTQLIASVALFALALLVIAASVVMTNQQVDRLNQREELVNDIQIGAGELGYLSNDYLLYHESPQLDRWNDKYAAFSSDLSNLSVDTPEQQVLVDNIRANQQRLKEVFDSVASTADAYDLTQGDAIDTSYIQVSWSRLAVQTRSIIFDASRLSQMLMDEENQAKQTNSMLIFALMGAFAAFLLIDYLLIYGRTLKSIGNLQAGTEIIGSGRLDHTIEAKKGDEIGDLAEAFNMMTARLKNVTASKADLEREMIERQRAEASIRRQAELIDLSPDAIMVRKPDGTITFWAHGAEVLYGFSKEEAIGKSAHSLLKTVFPEPLENIERKLVDASTWSGELIHATRDGRQVIVQSRWQAQRDGQGRIAEVFESNVDITGRKQAELAKERLLAQLEAKTVQLQQVNEELEVKGEEMAAQAEEIECTNEELRSNNDELQSVTRSLHEAQDYLESLINYANAPIIVWSPGFTITRFNRAFERLSGYTAGEVIGRDLSILFPPDSKDESLDRIKKTLEGEQWESVEIPIRHKYGSVRIVLWNSANIYDENNALRATIAQGQDITRRKEAENDLEEAKAQAELYLDLMGHDISNLHQIMVMQLDLAVEILKTEGKLEGGDMELIDSSVRTLDKAARLIDNVRKLQKLRTGEYGLETMDLATVLTDVLKDYSNIPGREITVKFNPDGRSLVQANPLLKDAFGNLVDNALKHSDGPLTLAINIGRVSRNNASYYRVTIEDNGNGIPDDKKEEVFSRFKRGQTKAKGTGLGLYLVKTLVEGFGGYTEIQNRITDDYTKGTRFLVYLPAKEEKDDGSQ